MHRTLSFVLFFTIALSLVGSVHYYIWARLVRDVAWPDPGRRIGTAIVIALFLCVPATFMLQRRLPPGHARWLFLALYTWMGVMFYLLVTLGLGDLAKLGIRAGHAIQHQPLDASRRLALARMVGGLVALVTGGATAAALASGLGKVMLRELAIKLPRLPASMNGTSIVQLTDVHLGPTIGRAFIEDLVRRTNALEPDIVAITGDLIDGEVDELRDAVAPLAKLRAKHGVYFVTGNHEYFYDADAWCAHIRSLGIRVLRNERVRIGDGDAAFDLAGVDDHEASRYAKSGAEHHGQDVAGALAGRNPARECVLLAHQPRAVTQAMQHGVGLQLSGHTHGGQIWPWRYMVYLQQPIVSGLGRFGDTLVWVSNGTGYWGPPMRLGAPPEITRITLTRG